MNKDTIWQATAADEGPAEIELPPHVPWDDDEHRTMLCRSCRLPRVFGRRKTQHSVHLMLAFATLGIWLPVWGITVFLQALKPWTCAVCGAHQRDR